MSGMRRRAENWGASSAEVSAPLPRDELLPDAELALHRAVSMRAPAPAVYRWLCQLRAAPYSYDLLDNFGRRSPQQLTPDLERLEVGQRFMTIFRLHSFEPNAQLTICHRGCLLGPVAVTYATIPNAHETHLLVRARWQPPHIPIGRAPLDTTFALGDLVMARRQLLNLKRLAERDGGSRSGMRRRRVALCRQNASMSEAAL